MRDDDAVRLFLEVRYTPELRAWVLGFGADAEVLAPERLRDDVAGQVSLMAATYSGQPRQIVAPKI